MKQITESISTLKGLIKIPKPPLLVSGTETLRQLHKDKHYQEGWEQAEILLKQFPDNTEILGFMIMFARHLGKETLGLGLALSHLQKHPNDFYLLFQLGMLYYYMHQLDKGIYFIHKVLEMDPNNHLIGGNLAVIYFEHGDFDLAIPVYQHQIDINAPDPSMPFGKGLALLAKGDYEHGWPAHESRFQLKDPDCRPMKLDTPIWDGKTDIAGKRLLVSWEQGNGDNIQFIRFISLLKQKTQATIICATLSVLHRLFKNMPGIDILIPENFRVSHDYQLAIQSIPYVLGLTTEAELLAKPYLSADSSLVSTWKAKIPDSNALKIGICWSGGKTYMHDTKRTLALKYFISLFSNPNIHLYSLQKAVSPEDNILLLAGNIPSLGVDFIDFADTAAAIASLDLVITVDTAVAHLAAAMGKPTWVLIRYETEWRHPWNRETSPWYSCMRLFRQQKAGEWDGIFSKLLEDLDLLIQKVKLQEGNTAVATSPAVLRPRETLHPTIPEEQPISIIMPAPTGPVSETEMLQLNQLFFENQYETCMTQAKAFLKRDPACLGALVTIARAAIPLGQLNLAFGILWRRLKDEPNNALTHYLLACAYKAKRQLDKSLTHAKRAFDLEPNNAIYCEMVAKNYYDRDDYNQAFKYYSQVNTFTETHETFINMSLAKLAAKEYKQGWELYEHRFYITQFLKDYVPSPMPFWDGKSDITGKKLLVIWEQGLGDVIQFIRFLPLLKKKTHAHICFVCGPKMARIAKKIHGIDMIHTTTALPAHDYKIYLLSLPLIFNIFKEKQFLPNAYIKPDTELVEGWGRRMPTTRPYKIGICWAGGNRYSDNIARNCPLGRFIQLLANPAYQLISLQKDLSAEDVDILAQVPIINIGNDFGDFEDTAAVIANLDLVISVDTAVAHLAGAMGKPVWTLIRYETEWRYPHGSDTSPWYPSMRLFRQKTPGDWDEVFARVGAALATFLPAHDS